MGPRQVILLRFRVDMGVMVIKGYFSNTIRCSLMSYSGCFLLGDHPSLKGDTVRLFKALSTGRWKRKNSLSLDNRENV